MASQLSGSGFDNFYMMLFIADPFVENVMFGSGTQTSSEMGEFKEMESVREDETETEDGSTSQFDFAWVFFMNLKENWKQQIT